MDWSSLASRAADLLPVRRWVLAVQNVLRGLSLAFILLWLAFMMLLWKPWGFDSDQRFWLIIGLLLAMCLTVGTMAVLSVLPGDPLSQGRQFGTEEEPLTRAEAQRLHGGENLPQLPGETNQTRK